MLNLVYNKFNIEFKIFLGGAKMTRDEMVSEISMRRDIPLEDVEDVLEEEELIELEELCARQKKKNRKKMCFWGTVIIFLAGAIVAIVVLDRKEKIDAENMLREYAETAKLYSDKMMNKIAELQSRA
jgi:hypothetical protein